MKRCSTLLAIQEIQIRNQTYNTIPLNTHQESNNEKDNNKSWKGCREIRTLINCWQKCKIVQPLGKTVWQFLERLNIELLHDPAIPLLGIYQREMRTYVHT